VSGNQSLPFIKNVSQLMKEKSLHDGFADKELKECIMNESNIE
jgi:hypothetical protein